MNSSFGNGAAIRRLALFGEVLFCRRAEALEALEEPLRRMQRYLNLACLIFRLSVPVSLFQKEVAIVPKDQLELIHEPLRRPARSKSKPFLQRPCLGIRKPKSMPDDRLAVRKRGFV